MLAAVAVALLAACSSATPTTSQAPQQPTGTNVPSFATPEDAVRAYLAGVAAGDANALLATSAVDDASGKFDFVAQAERLGIIQPVGNPGPGSYPFYASVNRSYFANRLLSQAQTLAYSVLSPNSVTANPVPADGPAASSFVQQVDPARLGGIQVLDVRPAKPSLESDPKYRANALAQAAVYGAADNAQRVALLGLGGSDYEVGFELLKYATGWKVLTQTSTLAGLPATGAATPITQDEFNRQTSAS
jgi:hypothetical protein